MKKIYKYPLVLMDEQTIQIPLGFIPLQVGLDPNKQLCLWCIVDPESDTRLLTIRIFGTGQPLPVDLGRYLGSVITESFVWHIFYESGR